MKFIDLTGQKFGRLTVISRDLSRRDRTLWICKCDCGNHTIIEGYCLRTGHTVSCGCYQKEKVSLSNTTHGLRNSRIYKTWCNMKKRCYDTNNNRYYIYGARGIKVCDEWIHSFENFYKDMGSTYKDELTLDRIDFNGNYCKENCRWATISEQENNKSNNHLITFNGETDTMMNMSKKYHLTYSTLKHRIQRGWNIKEALTTPQRNIQS